MTSPVTGLDFFNVTNTTFYSVSLCIYVCEKWNLLCLSDPLPNAYLISNDHHYFSYTLIKVYNVKNFVIQWIKLGFWTKHSTWNFVIRWKFPLLANYTPNFSDRQTLLKWDHFNGLYSISLFHFLNIWTTIVKWGISEVY